MFGRGRLSPRLHLATIWVVSAGTILSAFFILAANAWMQHPVGYTVEDGQAVLTDFGALLGNSTLWASFVHTVAAAFATGGALVLGISIWRAHRAPGDVERDAFRRGATLMCVVVLVTVVVTAVSGDLQARLMDVQQPMKMAAAEALYNTQNGASFSLLTIGNLSGQPIFQIRVPHLLSLIADLSWNGQVIGINQMQATEAARYGAGNYTPVLWLTYWCFRAMIGAGVLMILGSAWGIWLSWRRRLVPSRWFRRAALLGIALPVVANASGWIFTEAGRQPWIVYGLMETAKGVSTVSAADVAGTLAAFVAVYSILAVLAAILVVRAARHPLDRVDEAPGPDETPSAPGLVY